jgi:hypothetical protein
VCTYLPKHQYFNDNKYEYIQTFNQLIVITVITGSTRGAEADYHTEAPEFSSGF